MCIGKVTVPATNVAGTVSKDSSWEENCLGVSDALVVSNHPRTMRSVPQMTFSPMDFFKLHTGPVPIKGMDAGFVDYVQRHMDNLSVDAATIGIYDLLVTAPDKTIISALGGIGPAPVSLAHLANLLLCSERGDAEIFKIGPSEMNICYLQLPHRSDALLAVCAVRYKAGWYFTTNLTSDVGPVTNKPEGVTILWGNNQNF